MRKIAILLTFLLAVSLPSVALADDGGGGGHSFSSDYYGYGVVLGPISYDRDSVTGAPKQGWVLYARNQYDAACYVLGMQPADVTAITDVQRAKLSNASTGGDFYTFAQRAYRFGSTNIPSWVPSTANLGSLFTQQDDGKVWALDGYLASPFGTDYQEALEDLNAILNGEDIGGGGSGGEPVGDNLTFSGNVHYSYNSSNFFIYSDSTNTSSTKYYQMAYWRPSSNPWPQEFTPISNPFSFSIPKEVASTFIENHPFSSYDYFASLGLSTNGNLSKLYVYAFGKGNYTLNNRQNTYVDASSYISSISLNGNAVQYLDISLGSGYTYTYSGTSMTLSIPNATAIVRSDVSDVNGSSVGVILLPLSTSSEPTLPPTNWPDDGDDTPVEPTVPRAPDVTLPEPGDQPVDTPSNTTYIYNHYTNNNYTTTTYDGTDYTKQLKSIYDELKAFHADNLDYLKTLNSNVIDLVDGLGDVFDELKGGITRIVNAIKNNISWLYESISDDLAYLFDELFGAIEDNVQWLADELDYAFTGGGYNDSSVISWLRKIYYKLGSGTNTRPVDPVVDPKGFIDWLNNLVIDIWARIAGAGGAVMENLADSVAAILLKFPFSVPWDVMAMLGLLAAEPVTPSFELTIPIGDLTEVTLEGDLEWLDDAMGVIRTFELLGFCVYLAVHTPDVISISDSWGL